MTENELAVLNDRRAAFLAGEGVLTAQEIRDWAVELAPWRGRPSLPTGVGQYEPLMVSVAFPPTII